MQRKRCDQTPAWQQLQQYFEATGQQLDVREVFVQDSSRYASFSQQAPHVFADLSKNRVDATSQRLLLQLARECELERYRDAMFAGDAIKQLMSLQTKTAQVLRDGKEETIAIDEVMIDDILVTRPGEQVPTDGRIIAGTSALD